MKIVPVGYKIRDLRKSLRLKQDDLIKHGLTTAKNEKTVTRNLVSMVETCKASLTPKLAKIIKHNIEIALKDNQCKENNIDFEELFKSEEDQLRDYHKFILSSDDISHIKIMAEELVKLLEKYKMYQELATLYNKLGKLSLSRQGEAYTYFIKAFALKAEIGEGIEYLRLINNLKYSAISIGKYEESLLYTYSIDIESPIEDEEVKKQTYAYIFNNILAYKKLSMFNETFELIKIAKSLDKNLRLDILEAVVYSSINNYSKSIELYKKILKHTHVTDEQKALIYNNLIEISIEICENPKPFIEELLPLIKEDARSIDYILTISAASNDAERITYLKKAIELSINNKVNFDRIIKMFIEMNKVSAVHTEIMSGIASKLISTDSVLRIIKYYMSVDKNIAEQILKKVC